jgi:hypothetical protein
MATPMVLVVITTTKHSKSCPMEASLSEAFLVRKILNYLVKSRNLLSLGSHSPTVFYGFSGEVPAALFDE